MITRMTRREAIVAGSIGALGTAVFSSCASTDYSSPTQMSATPGTANVITRNGGTKPVYVPAPTANDPVSLSHADNLFWTDILAEHALFFSLLMPGPDLASQRAQAQDFQRRFTAQFQRIQQSGGNDYVGMSRSTMEIAKPFIDFKHRMREEQTAGRLNSLVWPLFFDHTAREAERFVGRLERFSRGDAGDDRSEVISFWSLIMAEHADFIAHLLDPEERALVQQAFKTSGDFRTLRAQQPASTGAAMQAAEDIINFKTAAEKGIQTGQIKSIINPALADHVRREAVKFADELRRVS